MSLNPLVFAALLLALSFAGCSGNKGSDADPTTTGTGSSTGSSTGPGTGTGNDTANRPPSGAISASVNGTNATFSLTGSDADNDTLAWQLDFGDGNSTNGTQLPSNVTHAYTVEGNVSVTFTLTDGTAPQSYNITILLVGGAAGSLGQVASMVWDVGVTSQAAPTAGTPYASCEDGPNRTFNYDSFTLDVATNGLPFKATITAASGAASIHSWRIFFNLEDCSDYAGGPFTGTGAAPITGIIPDDAGPYVFVMATGGFLLDVEYMSGSQIV